jgi:hypothetical protein
MVNAMSQDHCPFKIGQIVFYRPSPAGKGPGTAGAPPRPFKAGDAVRIMRIEDGKYVIIDGDGSSAGGLYWTEFSET